jgi:uncharacterized protein
VRRIWIFLLALLAGPAFAATERTGDVIDGTPVIERLDARDLAAGQLHRFWLRVADNAVGQGWYIPVIVVRGAKPGPRFLLTAAIHGDELSGVDVIHRLAAKLDPATLSGTVVAVPGLNSIGLLHRSRGFTPGDGKEGWNLNRLMPGNNDAGADIGERYAHALWTRLLRPNADFAIDLHTQSRGTAYVMYAFASTARTRAMANLIGPDIIKLDPGVKGSVETELVNDGVPAITLELGRPEMFDPVMIGRALDGIARVMADMKMTTSDGVPLLMTKPYIGNKIVPVRVSRGGFATLRAELGGDVKKGDIVATIADPFGRIVETIRAPESGRINTIATDPLRDPGDMVMRIVFTSDDPKCREGC